MIDPSNIAAILHNHPNQVRDIPFIPSVKDLQHHVTENSLNRIPIVIDNMPEELHRVWKAKMKGVSMKKAHEITRLASYIHSLPSHIPRDYIVDVGSGQGYLHRVLSAKHILALDSDEHQITGAETREKKVETKSTDLGAKVTHKTLDITPESLVSVIDDWISSIAPPDAKEDRIPVLIVALHACGSLHIDALQTFIHASKEQQSRRWYFSSAVTVPCCYNLLRPDDFPLSSDGPELLKDAGLPHPLPASAYHLAAQGELEERNKQKWELGIRKVVWRALVGPILEDTFTSGTSHPPIVLGTKEFIAPSEFTASKNATAPTPRRNLRTIAAPTFASVDSADPTSISKDDVLGNDTSGTGTSVLFQRLGKLPNAAYESWEVFMQHVERRLYLASTPPALTARGERSDSNSAIPPRINLPRTHPLYADAPFEPPSSSRAEQLEQLHIARCSLGPVIESVILKDRMEWAQQLLSNCQDKWEVQLVPLFDQKKGSARNMAIIVIPEAK
ncbi:hypothetical protein PM082_007747 [Marasmius tenuissimus]|nr:hypothetical protein PM082_007747 [Marasmius tenuissimus]